MTNALAPLRDPELVRLLADDPDLLAIADALVETHGDSDALRLVDEPHGRVGPLMRRRRLTLVFAVCLTVVAATAGTVIALWPSNTTGGSSRPLGGGTTVTNAAEADAVLPFSVVLPSNLTPTDMTAFPQSAGIAEGPELIANFGTQTDSPVFELVEHPTDWTVADLQQMANDWNNGSAQIVMVGSVHVLVGFDRRAPGGETDVAWIRGDGASPVITWLAGPWIEGQSFSQQQALSVAADIIGKGG